MDAKKLKLNYLYFDKLPVELQIMIFRYCLPSQRREIALVSKNWAENLQSFPEDYQLYLHDCYLREDIEPISLLMNSSRTYRYIRLGSHMTSQSPEVTEKFLTKLGSDVYVLDISENPKDIFLPKYLMLFTQLKKLVMRNLAQVLLFEEFPETLEHLHVKQFSIMEETKHIEHMRRIKNLQLLTSEGVQIKGGLDALVAIAAQFGQISTTMFTLDDSLKSLLESLTKLENIYFKVRTNLLNKPTITRDDVTEISLLDEPVTFLKFNEFPYLQSIDISWDRNKTVESPCFNFHEKVPCPNVQTLKIYWIKGRTCMGCFRSLIDSFPNVKKLIFWDYFFGNEHVKYICNKSTHLRHLEVESNRLDDETFFNDTPEYLLGNLKHLEVLNFSESKVDGMLEKWPFMPTLKKVRFGILSQPGVILNFIEKTPNMRFFEIGDGSNLTDTEIQAITQRWPHLQTLHFRCDMALSDAACSAIKTNCRRLKSLEMSLPRISIDMEYSFFKEMPSLRVLQNDHRTFYREEFYNIEAYVKRYRIPYEDLGKLQEIIPEYSIEYNDESDKSG